MLMSRNFTATTMYDRFLPLPPQCVSINVEHAFLGYFPRPSTIIFNAYNPQYSVFHQQHLSAFAISRPPFTFRRHVDLSLFVESKPQRRR